MKRWMIVAFLVGVHCASTQAQSTDFEGSISIDLSRADEDQGKSLAGNGEAGRIYELRIKVEEMPEISGWGAVIEYNPDRVRYVSGSFQASDFIPGLFALVAEDEGKVNVGGAELGTKAGNSGDGVLGTLAFEVLEGFADSTSLILTEAVWYRTDGMIEKENILSAVSIGTDAAAGNQHTQLPVSTRLEQNHPNPFNSSTTVRYQVAESGLVQLDIFNLAGQKIRSLVSAQQEAGIYRVSWDGTDSQGAAVSTGIYLTRLQISDFAEIKKMLLLR